MVAWTLGFLLNGLVWQRLVHQFNGQLAIVWASFNEGLIALPDGFSLQPKYMGVDIHGASIAMRFAAGTWTPCKHQIGIGFVSATECA
jgi:hypothetical protein